MEDITETLKLLYIVLSPYIPYSYPQNFGKPINNLTYFQKALGGGSIVPHREPLLHEWGTTLRYFLPLLFSLLYGTVPPLIVVQDGRRSKRANIFYLKGYVSPLS